MSLPIYQTKPDMVAPKDFSLLQTNWAQQLNPVIANPITQGLILKNVNLNGPSVNSGMTVINHMLGRVMQGYIIIFQNGTAGIFCSAPFNAQTLTLTSDSNISVNLYVF